MKTLFKYKTLSTGKNPLDFPIFYGEILSVSDFEQTAGEMCFLFRKPGRIENTAVKVFFVVNVTVNENDVGAAVMIHADSCFAVALVAFVFGEFVQNDTALGRKRFVGFVPCLGIGSQPFGGGTDDLSRFQHGGRTVLLVAHVDTLSVIDFVAGTAGTGT